MTSAAPTQKQDRLKAHFNDHAPTEHSKRWDDLWSAGDFLPWDRGYANPALIDTLAERKDLLPSPKSASGKRARALVPGCGKGYDIALFAAHGYDSFGLEVSENAVRVSEDYLREPGEGPLEGEYKISDEKVGRGAMKCLLGDFFEDGWLEGTGGLGEGFDVIYDNTFLCALHPTIRPQWAQRMAQLLAPGGVLICLEFPTHKPPKSGGPPFSLPPTVHEELLKRPGEEIQYGEDGKVLSTDRAESDKALVRVAHWKPKRTHQVAIINGEITDWVSVWRHK
ncbi:uncharacterized protein N0V89_009133 [Didymosphaeria variabile]|uniref:S-adenosyl-L-methionine-dependent methyltransferase n=1 Tax=Didymosphaeria variabile TaxID=1932322 RepID=A0A9W9C9Y0_9PLEO|nr:uncharacterized protein N0V89_009133 [Didymosphaeria variabile]KAJ4350512.1 hypothetical protein N0V89_009133 [Didymosphaeria variabile]